MSNSRNTNKLPDKNRLETPNADKNDEQGKYRFPASSGIEPIMKLCSKVDVSFSGLKCKPTESFTYGGTSSI